MKHFLFVFVLVLFALLPSPLFAAYLIDGIYYDLSGSEATVTYKEQGYYGWGGLGMTKVHIPFPLLLIILACNSQLQP